MRSFFQRLAQLVAVTCFVGGLLVAVTLSAEAARCGCACNDGTLQSGTVAGACTATACNATCTTACTTHRGRGTVECAPDPTPPPAPAEGALCSCGCGEGLRFIAAPGGACGGADVCTAACRTECTGHGAFVDATCDSGATTVPTPGSCVQRALSRPGMSATRRRRQEETVARIESQPGSQPRTTWTCQSLPSDQINENRCVSLGCEGTPFCCVPGTGSAPVTTSEGGAPGGGGEAGTPPAPTENCAQVALRNRTTQATIDGVARQTGTDPSVWTCQRVCSREQRSNCVTRGCRGEGQDEDVLCCPPSIGIPEGQTCGGRGASGSTNGTSGGGNGIGVARLVLPNCATTHDPRTAGKCQIADVFELGYAAVRFMFGLSGALLLVAFVVSGFKYLVNGYAGDIKQAKETMVNATLGMVIMVFAYIVVTFLYNALTR